MRHWTIIRHMWHIKRICVFEHSVMTNFNCACPAIQRGQGSGFLSEGSSWLTARIGDKYQLLVLSPLQLIIHHFSSYMINEKKLTISVFILFLLFYLFQFCFDCLDFMLRTNNRLIVGLTPVFSSFTHAWVALNCSWREDYPIEIWAIFRINSV